MKVALTIILLFFYVPLASAQMQFKSYGDYCTAMSELSTPPMLARTQSMPRSFADQSLKDMTDPFAIKMAREAIEFAYSKPISSKLEDMKSELKLLCMNKKLFVQ